MTTSPSKTIRKSYHVMPAMDEGWSVRRFGTRRAEKHFATKEAAVDYAVQRSQDKSTDLYIHRRDGGIANRRSYAPDPFPVRDF